MKIKKKKSRFQKFDFRKVKIFFSINIVFFSVFFLLFHIVQAAGEMQCTSFKPSGADNNVTKTTVAGEKVYSCVNNTVCVYRYKKRTWPINYTLDLSCENIGTQFCVKGSANCQTITPGAGGILYYGKVTTSGGENLDAYLELSEVGCAQNKIPAPRTPTKKITLKNNFGNSYEFTIYECVESSPQNQCGANKNGVDRSGNPKSCPTERPCERQWQQENAGQVYLFASIEDFQTSDNKSIKKGNLVYCLSSAVPENRDNFRSFEDKCVYIGKGTISGADFNNGTIEQKFQSADFETLAVNFKPVYECQKETGQSNFWGFLTSLIGSIITTVLGLIFSIIALVCTVLLILVFAFLEWMIGMANHDLSIVQVIWTYIRDLCNMFFIIILIYIAFRTVITRSSSTLAKMLPTFFAAVILINFSKIICETVMGGADLLVKMVYHLKDGNNSQVLGGGGNIAGQAWGIVNYVARAVGMDSLFKIWQPAGDLIKNFKQGGAPLETLLSTIGSMMLGIFYMVCAIIVFGLAGVLLAYRIIIIWILTAISPAIYAAWGAGMHGTVKKFWSEFLKTAFFAPAMIFCVVLSVYVLSPVVDQELSGIASDTTVSKVTAQIDKGNMAGAAQNILSDKKGLVDKLSVHATKFESFIRLIFALAFMWAGIVVAKKASIYGSSAVIQGAEKLAKQGGAWLSMYKPSKAGLKALGRWGWERQIRRHPSLGFLSPTAWKQAYTAHRDRVKRQTYTPAAAKLQARISGPRGFFFGNMRGLGRSKAFKKEQMYSDVMVAQMAKKHASELLDTDLPTEVFIKRLDEKLEEMEKRGLLGKDKALDFEVEGILRAILSRGDINDALKGSKYLTRYSEGRAVTGADSKVWERLFGTSERAVSFANVIGEASKDKYNQFTYDAHFDEATKLKTDDEGEIEVDKASNEMRYIFDTNVFRKYIDTKAKKVGHGFEEMYNLVVDNLGRTKEQIEEDTEGIENTEVRSGVAAIIDTYNKQRGGAILGELIKKDPRAKWRVHPGAVWADLSGEAAKAAGAPEGVKYWGETASTEAFMMSLTRDDAIRIGTYATPRVFKAWKDNEENAERIVARIKEKDTVKGRELEGILKAMYENIHKKESEEEEVRVAEGD